MIRQKLGVCYYPEHWPENYWARDAARMRETGISYVRIGEFAWSRLEPRRGAYAFDWLARAIETLHAEGLEVVLGTPTATPPKWLVDEAPDMLALDSARRPRGFGSRRHYCFSHEGYARECERIVEALAATFGPHSGVAAWQIDNEYGCHDTVESYSPAAQRGFRDWCAQKYETIDALNAAWGNVFWSMEYSGFEAIELPILTVTQPNPAHLLDFQRYSSDRVVAFNRRLVEIVRRHSPGRAILHNFMGGFLAFDHHAVSRDLDAAAWDSYPLGYLERAPRDEAFKARYMRVGDPDYQAFHHDLYRGCGRGRWWVMEQQPGAVNWAPWNPAPAQGAVRMWTHEAFAAGAEAVCYFRWRQAPFAQEQMHEGLLLPNSEPNDTLFAARRVADELAALRAEVATRRAEVALVFDYESAWATQILPQGADFSYFELLLAFYRGLRGLGLSVDIVAARAEEIKDRKCVIAPALFAPHEEFVAALRDGGATTLLGPRAGAKTPDFQIPQSLPPGPLRALIDIQARRVESLRPGARVPVEGAGAFERWREFIAAGDAVAIDMRSDDGEAALLRGGAHYYLAGWPDAPLLDVVLAKILRDARVETIALPQDLRMRDHGARRFLFNYGPEPIDIGAILGDAALAFGENPLPPCGVAAFQLD